MNDSDDTIVNLPKQAVWFGRAVIMSKEVCYLRASHDSAPVGMFIAASFAPPGPCPIRQDRSFPLHIPSYLLRKTEISELGWCDFITLLP
jgi:hypothetical protein